MKKLLASLLALTMLACMAGCQPKTAPESAPPTAESGETQQQPKAEAKPKGEKAAFEETVVADNDECLVKLTDMKYDEVFGCTVGIHIENKSTEKVYMFCTGDTAINNIQVDPYWAYELGTGASFDDEITISNDQLKEIGVAYDDITDLELSFRVYDTDDYNGVVAEEALHIYPYGEECAVAYTREPQDSDVVLMDTPEVQMVAIGYDHDDFWGYEVKTYLLNKTDSEVMFSVDSAEVNGIELDPYYAESLAAGKSTFSHIAWDDSVLEKNGIEKVEDIKLTLSAYDCDDLSKDNYVDEQKAELKP